MNPRGFQKPGGGRAGVHRPPTEKVGQSRGEGSLPSNKLKVKPADRRGGPLLYPCSLEGLQGLGSTGGVLVKKEKVETLSCPFIFFNF